MKPVATRPRLRQALGWTVAVAACMGVFALYLQPHFLVALADQLWACF
jgi:hypothetical protein